MTRIERGFAILLLLSDGRLVTAPALAERFEVSVRTIYRDMEMLSATGVPVYAERGVEGGYRLMEGFFLPPVSFSRDEAVAVLMGLALARGLRVPPFPEELESAKQKLVSVLPERMRALLTETRRLIGFEGRPLDAFHPEEKPESIDPETARAIETRAVEIFIKAVLDGTQVRFGYRSTYRRGNNAPPVEAEPQGVLWDRDRWYLIGRKIGSTRSGGQRFWRADRIIEIEATTLRAQPSPDFDVRKHLGRRWLADAMAAWAKSAPVRIRMTTQQAERLKLDWFFGLSSFERTGKNEVIMTYGEVDAPYAMQLVRWLGPGAEILEPAEWREQMKDELERMCAAYA
ncbi:MAG: YafY family transcriptional regulator [Alphaproteobacteria bacterium]|nr:YafY family transcriptional regulator [Alphaproteobacteria bacterium]